MFIIIVFNNIIIIVINAFRAENKCLAHSRFMARLDIVYLPFYDTNYYYNTLHNHIIYNLILCYYYNY